MVLQGVWVFHMTATVMIAGGTAIFERSSTAHWMTARKNKSPNGQE